MTAPRSLSSPCGLPPSGFDGAGDACAGAITAAVFMGIRRTMMPDDATCITVRPSIARSEAPFGTLVVPDFSAGPRPASPTAITKYP